MTNKAWVTLATNDTYSLGALVLAHSLRRVNTEHTLVVLITTGVTPSMRSLLQSAFHEVKLVDILDSKDETNLKLLSRPELGITFTKLHCWKLTDYEKCVFLDADTLILENSDDLFNREELSAAPDVGWPDCFNSGVFVFKPSVETFNSLINFAIENGSFDGGDQGLLNSYFSDWATGDIKKHLPFVYNLSSAAIYSYIPAFKQFGKNVKIVHFISDSKPWLQSFNTETRQVDVPSSSQHLKNFLQLWWNIFCEYVHPALSNEMGGLARSFAEIKLGEPLSPEQKAVQDHLRRQNWEQGNIDYMNRDSFDNIWGKIQSTLSLRDKSTVASEDSNNEKKESSEEVGSVELNNIAVSGEISQIIGAPHDANVETKTISHSESESSTPREYKEPAGVTNIDNMSSLPTAELSQPISEVPPSSSQVLPTASIALSSVPASSAESLVTKTTSQAPVPASSVSCEAAVISPSAPDSKLLSDEFASCQLTKSIEASVPASETKTVQQSIPPVPSKEIESPSAAPIPVSISPKKTVAPTDITAQSEPSAADDPLLSSIIKGDSGDVKTPSQTQAQIAVSESQPSAEIEKNSAKAVPQQGESATAPVFSPPTKVEASDQTQPEPSSDVQPSVVTTVPPTKENEITEVTSQWQPSTVIPGSSPTYNIEGASSKNSQPQIPKRGNKKSQGGKTSESPSKGKK